MARRSSNLLVLFDIDGTLTRRAGPAHRDALVAAVRQILGVETRNDNIPLHGMLDPDILMQMMINAGVAQRRAKAALPAICRAAERWYMPRVPDLRAKICPGARRLLYRLHRRGAVLGIVSGNLERIGWKKLRRAGLHHYFRFGIFAGHAPTRIELAALAIRHAEGRGWVNGRSRRVLVGDTPNDVAAGRANRMETIAVATGISTFDELRASGPSLCAADLTDPAVTRWFIRS